MSPIPDRIEGHSETMAKLRATPRETRQPMAQKRMKHQMAAMAAQMGILP